MKEGRPGERPNKRGIELRRQADWVGQRKTEEGGEEGAREEM